MPAVKPGVNPARKCTDKALDARQLADRTAVDLRKCGGQARLDFAEPLPEQIGLAVRRRGAGLTVRDEKAVHIADAEQFHLLVPVADEAVIAAVGKHQALDFVVSGDRACTVMVTDSSAVLSMMRLNFIAFPPRCYEYSTFLLLCVDFSASGRILTPSGGARRTDGGKPTAENAKYRENYTCLWARDAVQ